MMHANDEEFQDNQKELYTNRCLPTHHRENPMLSGDIALSKGDNPLAYEMYSIAAKLHYPHAKAIVDELRPKLTAVQLTQSEKNLKKYSEIHLASCYFPGSN